MFIELIRNDKNIASRFWSKVDRSDGPDSCWNWTGAIDSPGYGAFKINTKKVNSHRVAWALVNDEWPQNSCVIHKCDNRLCCNPDHLSLGSKKDNMQDCIERGRFAVGENTGTSKLTEEQVRAVRQLAANGSTSYAIAKAMAVNEKTIQNIVGGHAWKHVQIVS
jgi:HNH endonuclease